MDLANLSLGHSRGLSLIAHTPAEAALTKIDFSLTAIDITMGPLWDVLDLIADPLDGVTEEQGEDMAFGYAIAVDDAQQPDEHAAPADLLFAANIAANPTMDASAPQRFGGEEAVPDLAGGEVTEIDHVAGLETVDGGYPALEIEEAVDRLFAGIDDDDAHFAALFGPFPD